MTPIPLDPLRTCPRNIQNDALPQTGPFTAILVTLVTSPPEFCSESKSKKTYIMNKCALIIAFVVLVFASSGSCQIPSPSLSPQPSPPELCYVASWSPETHAYYGKKEIILEKLAKLPINLSKHRIFLQVTQGDVSGNVKLFERHPDGRFTVTEWAPPDTLEILDAIDKAIIANKGVNCVGEQIKAVLLEKLGEKEPSVGAVPVSPAAAFNHAVNKATGDFIKTVIILGC